MVSPDRNRDLLALVGHEGILDWEIKRKPAVHACGVCLWID